MDQIHYAMATRLHYFEECIKSYMHLKKMRSKRNVCLLNLLMQNVSLRYIMT